MSSYIKRILVDLVDININPLEIYIHYNDSNITTIYALIGEDFQNVQTYTHS